MSGPKSIISFEDAKAKAKRKLPRMIFDFIEGSAGREIASNKNLQIFNDIHLRSRVLASVGNPKLNSKFLNYSFDLPFGIAPMGMCNLAWPDADKNLAEAAKKFNIPHCVSTAASSSLEDLKKWGEGQTWFQLYVNGPTEEAWNMVDRAEASGYKTLILTVDVPVVSRRVRDLRNGFVVPFKIGLKQLVDFALHPHWSLSTIIKGIPEPKNFRQGSKNNFDRNASRAGANWEFLVELRKKWQGNLIVKGVMDVVDAKRIQNAGIDAIWVSNHGGRQLDSSPPALLTLPKIRDSVGPNMPLIFDSGVRSGEDIVKALAFGANFVMLGRPIMMAIAASSEKGLNDYLLLLKEEIEVVMAQLGIKDSSKISGDALYTDISKKPQREIHTENKL
ncbi:alpha-hydroxy-acid oxidizing protein [Paracoccaceae bacterium]|jgi:L-lactate dehydrogenase (cytochrome)|nr:alpha-hydroxy-acid oxidizing protein [Paracoccaceae bacterium]